MKREGLGDLTLFLLLIKVLGSVNLYESVVVKRSSSKDVAAAVRLFYSYVLKQWFIVF